MKRRLARLAVALSIGLGACNAERITWADDGLVLDASISDARIGSGETATLTYRLVNVGRATRTLQSSDSCTLLLYIEDERGVVVHPQGGGWGCLPLYPPPTVLEPSDEMARTDQLRAGSGVAYNGSTITLPQGRYRARVEYTARLVDADRKIELRSREVAFEVE